MTEASESVPTYNRVTLRQKSPQKGVQRRRGSIQSRASTNTDWKIVAYALCAPDPNNQLATEIKTAQFATNANSKQKKRAAAVCPAGKGCARNRRASDRCHWESRPATLARFVFGRYLAGPSLGDRGGVLGRLESCVLRDLREEEGRLRGGGEEEHSCRERSA